MNVRGLLLTVIRTPRTHTHTLTYKKKSREKLSCARAWKKSVGAPSDAPAACDWSSRCVLPGKRRCPPTAAAAPERSIFSPLSIGLRRTPGILFYRLGPLSAHRRRTPSSSGTTRSLRPSTLCKCRARARRQYQRVVSTRPYFLYFYYIYETGILLPFGQPFLWTQFSSS